MFGEKMKNIVEKVKNVKNSAMLDAITGPQQRHLHMYPIILTSFCRRHNTLSVKGKTFSKYRKLTKTLGGFHRLYRTNYNSTRMQCFEYSLNYILFYHILTYSFKNYLLFFSGERSFYMRELH